VLLAVTVGSDNFSRVLGVLVIAALVLYEPILVSRIGGTLGHYFNNLRVVDEGDGGNISFLKACARVVIKGLLAVLVRDFGSHTPQPGGTRPADRFYRANPRSGKSVARSIYCRA
jgi:hypothetical protein